MLGQPLSGDNSSKFLKALLEAWIFDEKDIVRLTALTLKFAKICNFSDSLPIQINLKALLKHAILAPTLE